MNLKEKFLGIPEHQSSFIIKRIKEILEQHKYDTQLQVKVEVADVSRGLESRVWIYNNVIAYHLLHNYNGRYNEDLWERAYGLIPAKEALNLMESYELVK